MIIYLARHNVHAHEPLPGTMDSFVIARSLFKGGGINSRFTITAGICPTNARHLKKVISLEKVSPH